jgi:pyridoxine 4-dehydrogenase
MTQLATTDIPAAAAGTFMLADELEIRRAGFGAMRITGDGIWGPPRDRAAAKRVLQRAVELGVNLIDTADSYGPFVSEEIIAEALYPYPPGLIIATKGGLVRPSKAAWDPDGRPEHLRQACEGSLRRLKLERIDLYQLHAPDPRVPFAESVQALAELQQRGLIRHIGLSNVGVSELTIARSLVRVVSVQNRYNLADRSSERVLEYCERERIGFLPWYPLATGTLAKAGGVLAQIAERHQATPAQIALSWLLHRSKVMLPIAGTADVKHLEANVAAARLALSSDDMAALAALATRA